MADGNLERMQGKPQNEAKHPDEYQRDLNPDHMAGQNIGGDLDRELGMRTAHDIKDLSRGINLSDDELRRVHVLPDGERLQQGGTYIDLRDRARGEFTASGDMAAGEGNAYVAKDQASYDTWNKLCGIDAPRRTT